MRKLLTTLHLYAALVTGVVLALLEADDEQATRGERTGKAVSVRTIERTDRRQCPVRGAG
jgi:hypothetical protein